jgi:hypothetical protein
MFDSEKLKSNALTSIRLGVEDFMKSQKAGKGGDPGRALSATRNLFAGILLLFKFRIVASTKDPEEGKKLILNAAEVVPRLSADGQVRWEATKYRKSTIDIADIRRRFAELKISTDWEIVDALQEERNAIEHLHPLHAHGATAKFVADTFPLLRDFILNELHEEPVTLLGYTWQTMLSHHEFLTNSLERCHQQWRGTGLSKSMLEVACQMACEDCGSPLIRPTAERDAGEREYMCEQCAHRAPLIPQLRDTLQELDSELETLTSEHQSVVRCPDCDTEAFVMRKGECFSCGYTLEVGHLSCILCSCALTLEDQNFNGLCGRHASPRPSSFED